LVVEEQAQTLTETQDLIQFFQQLLLLAVVLVQQLTLVQGQEDLAVLGVVERQGAQVIHLL
jgi:hypothetical protein